MLRESGEFDKEDDSDSDLEEEFKKLVVSKESFTISELAERDKIRQEKFE